MVTGLVKWLLVLVIWLLVWFTGIVMVWLFGGMVMVWLYGYWFVIWLMVWVYGYWFGYMVTGLVIWLLDRLYSYWFGYMFTGLVRCLPSQKKYNLTSNHITKPVTIQPNL